METDQNPDSAKRPKDGVENPRVLSRPPLGAPQDSAVIAPVRRRKPNFFKRAVSARDLMSDAVSDQTLAAAGLGVATATDFFEPSTQWYSPQTASGSMLWATLVHGAVYVALVIYLAVANGHHVDDVAQLDTFTYDTFSSPPSPTQVVKHVARVQQPDTPQEKTPIVKGPKEIQDDTSKIAGTQTAAQAKPTASSDGVGDAATTPYYRIKPQYPRAALISGVEGYILLKIDINEKGEVENARVTGGEQRNMFQDEARRAVSKWKYKPFLDSSGKPIRKTDHEVRVDFKLKDAA